jgi:hypothetical protein
MMYMKGRKVPKGEYEAISLTDTHTDTDTVSI